MTRVLVIAGVASGVGKTSVTLGLLEALRHRGLTVQAFKVGPDFIDPQLHASITGRPSYNLDGFMCGKEAVRATVARASAGADVAIVEGMMGCFDGVDGTSDLGSTAQVAKWLGAPVVLVVDASAQSRSAAAVVLGFERFDADLRIAAVVPNRVGGGTHARWVIDAIRAACHAEPVGAIAHDATLVMAERHLGLVTPADGVLTHDLRDGLRKAVERGVDIDRLRALAAPLATAELAPRPRAEPRVSIAVARDAAFQFYYEENLELLREAGARLIFWSPIADGEPPDADGLYFGGGYPELHAEALADNGSCRKAVRAFVDRGGPLYAECGGLMYLAEALEDGGGRAHAMVGVLPSRVRMRPPRMTLGYVTVRFATDTPLGAGGSIVRGHRFHFSTLDPVPDDVPRAYEGAEGYLVGRALLSYAHLHFASNPGVARAFVDACAEWRP
jgi:cobyrinic acid a,c-diamide synthase